MAYVKPTSPILYSEGGPIYHLQANGAITAGQCLTAYGTMECDQAADADDAFIGVAQYDVADNGFLSVIGPGNIVRLIAQTSGIAVGDDIMISGTEGKVGTVNLAAGTKIGVALEAATADDATLRVLLV